MSGLLAQLLSTPAWLVLALVFALPALESSAFLGFVFPGETAVLLGGVAASQGHVPLGAVLAAGVGGAILGDSLGYLIGRRWGRRVLGSTLGRFINERHLDRAERALIRRGGWAVFIGRFTVALRVMIPGLAGMAQMPYRRFAAANVLGAVAWGGLMVTAGYLAGNAWHTVEHYVTGAGAGLAIALLAIFVGRHLVRRLLGRRAQLRQENAAAQPATTNDQPFAMNAPRPLVGRSPLSPRTPGASRSVRRRLNSTMVGTPTSLGGQPDGGPSVTARADTSCRLPGVRGGRFRTS